VRAADAGAIEALIEGLSPRDRRWRFHGAVTGVTPWRLARMAEVDPLRELALVGVAPVGGALLADVRCVIDDVGDDVSDAAEFALMVAAGHRRQGLGAWALAGLRHAAAERGLRWLVGTVCADNRPMLELLRGAGFLCTPRRRDGRWVAVETCLQVRAGLQRH
jgi:acetyltransferase